MPLVKPLGSAEPQLKDTGVKNDRWVVVQLRYYGI